MDCLQSTSRNLIYEQEKSNPCWPIYEKEEESIVDGCRAQSMAFSSILSGSAHVGCRRRWTNRIVSRIKVFYYMAFGSFSRWLRSIKSYCSCTHPQAIRILVALVLTPNAVSFCSSPASHSRHRAARARSRYCGVCCNVDVPSHAARW